MECWPLAFLHLQQAAELCCFYPSVLNFTIGVSNTAPVLNTGNLLGRPSRLILYWNHIDWRAVAWYAPFALLGAAIAGYFFSKTNITILQIIVGAFLISTVFQFRWGKRPQSFAMRYSWLAPLGLIISTIGTWIGAAGSLLNPFYLNLGLSKESLIANSFFMGIAQVSSYSYFGLMTGEEWGMAIALGLGISLGNFIGKKALQKITDTRFRQWAIAFMVISGILLIIRAISLPNSTF